MIHEYVWVQYSIWYMHVCDSDINYRTKKNHPSNSPYHVIWHVANRHDKLFWILNFHSIENQSQRLFCSTAVAESLSVVFLARRSVHGVDILKDEGWWLCLLDTVADSVECCRRWTILSRCAAKFRFHHSHRHWDWSTSVSVVHHLWPVIVIHDVYYRLLYHSLRVSIV